MLGLQVRVWVQVGVGVEVEVEVEVGQTILAAVEVVEEVVEEVEEGRPEVVQIKTVLRVVLSLEGPVEILKNCTVVAVAVAVAVLLMVTAGRVQGLAGLLLARERVSVPVSLLTLPQTRALVVVARGMVRQQMAPSGAHGPRMHWSPSVMRFGTTQAPLGWVLRRVFLLPGAPQRGPDRDTCAWVTQEGVDWRLQGA